MNYYLRYGVAALFVGALVGGVLVFSNPSTQISLSGPRLSRGCRAGGCGDTALLRVLQTVSASQVASGAPLYTAKGVPVTLTRASSKTCDRGSSSFDGAQMLLNPERMDVSSSWPIDASGTSVTVMANATTDAFGNQTATRFDFPALGAGSTYALVRQSVANPATQTLTYSLYLKAVSAPGTIYLQVGAAGTPTSCAVTATAYSRCTLTQAGVGSGSVPVYLGYNNIQAMPGGGNAAFSVYAANAKLEASATATAYVPGNNQQLVYLTANQPCVETPGLLLEGTSTNLMLQSADVSNAAWVKSNSVATAPVVTANACIAPDGTMTASRVDYPAVTSGFSIAYQSFSATASVYTASIYAKAFSGTPSVELFVSPNGVNGGFATINPGTAWQRYSVVSTLSAATWYIEVGSDMRRSGATPFAASSVCLWGGNFSNDSGLSSYVPALATSATRALDSASVPMNGLQAAAGRMQLTITPSWSGAANAYFLSTSFNTFMYTPGGSVPGSYVTGAAGFTASGSGTFVAGVPKSYLLQWRGASVTLGQVGGATNSTAFTGLTNTSGPLILGGQAAAPSFWLQGLAVYPD